MHSSPESRRRIYTTGRQKKGNDRVKSEGNELEKKKKKQENIFNSLKSFLNTTI